MAVPEVGEGLCTPSGAVTPVPGQATARESLPRGTFGLPGAAQSRQRPTGSG